MAQDVLKQLTEIKEQDPHLAEVADLYGYLIVAQSAALVASPIVAPFDAVTALTRFSEGIPLIRAEETALDWQAFATLYGEVCRIGAEHRPDLAEVFEGLHQFIKDNPDQIRDLAARFLNDGTVRRLNSAEDTESPGESIQIELLNFILTHTLHPFLRAQADALKQLLEEQLGACWDKGWQHSRCALCGGLPDFAFLDEGAGQRHLVCSRCDSSWRFPRIKCPFCNTTEPSDLSYYPATDIAYRVYVCHQCKRYLKAVDRRRSPLGFSVTAERVRTLGLDLEAREQGFR
jgi:FdhE protein